MTEKQKKYIEFIEEFSGTKFTGNPNDAKDVSEYINENKDKAHLLASDNWAIKNDY